MISLTQGFLQDFAVLVGTGSTLWKRENPLPFFDFKELDIVSPDGKQTEDKSTMFICKKCFSIVSKGLTHECNHINLAKNVIILLEDVEQNRKEQIVSSLLDTFKKDNTEKNNVIKLQTKVYCFES